MSRLIERLRVNLTDLIASYIATWKFILIYTLIMTTWIVLHIIGVLNIDTLDFIKYNLFLSWMSGIQASIVLMASNRQAEIDRMTMKKSMAQDKSTHEDVLKMHKKLNTLFNKIDKIEEIISLMEEEEGITNDR